MIEISEKTIQDNLRIGLKLLREDENLFDRIFRKLNVTEASRLKKYIMDNKVHVTQGYPVGRSRLPCFAIMLGGENEDNNFLGDFATELDTGMADEMELDTEEILREERIKVGRHNEVITMETGNKNVTSVTYMSTEDGEAVDLEGLDIEDPQQGILTLRGSNLAAGDYVNVSYTYVSRGFTSFGAMFNKSYRIEVWATNGDLVVHLYHLLKWILLFSRNNFLENGWREITLGGADFEPVPGHENETTFRRAVSLSFAVEESYELSNDYIQDIIVKYMSEGELEDD